jgi:hypothetical protein
MQRTSDSPRRRCCHRCGTPAGPYGSPGATLFGSLPAPHGTDTRKLFMIP